MNMKLKAILAGVSMFVLLSSVSSAFATHQPYIGGHPDTSTIYYLGSVFGYADHGGLKPTTNIIQNVLSTTGAASAGATNPTAWIYQDSITTNTAGSIKADPEIRDCDSGGTCTLVWDRETPHGTYTDTSYVYHTFIWQGSPGSRTGINFVYEWHYTSGSIQNFIESYVKGSNGDPSQYFMAGKRTQSFGGTNYYVKFLQFGVESTGGTATGWKQKQYGMGFSSTAGTQFLANFQARSMQGGTADTDVGSSLISYTVSGPYLFFVGHGNYVANANYAQRGTAGCGDASLPPAGTVKWCKDPTMLPANTRLW